MAMATLSSALAELPNVEEDKKSAATSALTLKAIWSLGKKNYGDAATKAVTNLAGNKDLADVLEVESKLSKNFSFLSLKRICAIESQCDLTFAYSKASYKGYFQMGKDACTDVGTKFTDIDEKSEWKKSCEAGRLFLDLNWKRLADKGASLTDGTMSTLTLIYLTHQLGAGGGPALFKTLNDGTAASAEASKDMLANIPPKATASMIGAAGHKITQLEFYAYWAGSIQVVMDKFP
jgi:hypothetical protein